MKEFRIKLEIMYITIWPDKQLVLSMEKLEALWSMRSRLAFH